MGDPASRRRFGRQDLDELKQYDRPAVLAALGSFDERELDDREFTLRAASLLDPERVPDLPDALDSGAAPAIAEAVHRACLERGGPARTRALPVRRRRLPAPARRPGRPVPGL